MPNLNPNSTNYTHSYEPNTNDLTMAMGYNNSGQPIVRVMPGDAYARSAYHVPKIVQDFTIFTGEATLRVPKRVWEQEDINVEVVPATIIHKDVDGIYVLSEDHMLTVKSGTTLNRGHTAKTKEFFRIQANRGALYSWSAEYPNPNSPGVRAVGPSSGENGISLFMVGTGTGYDLFYSRRRGGAVITQVNLNSYLPQGFDISKGHLYDLRMQWRGVGNIEVIIDGVLIYTEEILGTLTGLNVNDNALPFVIACSCAEQGTEVKLQIGCVNVSSEGGMIETTLFGSITTDGLISGIPADGAAILALRVPRYITYNGSTIQNTRGTIADKLVSWIRSEAVTQVWYGRDYNIPNLEALTWNAVPDSNLQYLIGGSPTALNTAFAADRAKMVKLISEFQEQEVKNEIINPSPHGRFEVSPGDVLVVFVDPINNNIDAHAALYYSEQL